MQINIPIPNVVIMSALGLFVLCVIWFDWWKNKMINIYNLPKCIRISWREYEREYEIIIPKFWKNWRNDGY